MATSDYVFGNKQWEINKWILTLSVLGLFSKLLMIDLSEISVFGVNMGNQNTALIPGFIGLALMYALCAYFVARMELQMAHGDETQQKAVSIIEKLQSSKLLLILSLLTMPLPLLLYTLIPIGLSLFTLYLLSGDILAVLTNIYAAL